MLRLGKLVVVAAFASACNNSANATTPSIPIQDVDDGGYPFNKDEIVPSAAFTDFTALAATDVQSFVEHSPYTGESFLGTYQSNGVTFAAAVVNVAQTYRINPIVLLVAVEAKAGLVAATTYPPVPSTVDYLFGCGCSLSPNASGPGDASVCDPSAAGLDVQLACYANALRTSLDQVAVSGTTQGGWGPGTTATTLDGIAVKPKDDSTAALYQYDPVVGTGRSGNSLFSTIWLEFTQTLSYESPQGGAAGALAEVGDSCLVSSECAISNAICATGSGYPGGMCTSHCTGSCPASDAFCAAFTSGGYCLALCNPTVPASCRSGYSCTLVQPSGAPSGTPPSNVCTPQ